MNGDYIFNPWFQEFVHKDTPEGKTILYLEDLCIKCNKSNEIYDIDKKKCVVKKRFNSIDRKNLQLCKDYLQTKQKTPPIEKGLILKLLNIKVFNKTISEWINVPFNFKNREIDFAIKAIISFMFLNWFKMSQANVLNTFISTVISIIQPYNDNVGYFIRTIIKFLTDQYQNIYKYLNFAKSVRTVVSKIWTLFNDYKYLPLYYTKTAILFILGSFEYYLTEMINYELDSHMINNIVLLFSKNKRVTSVEVVSKSQRKQKTTDIFDTIPNYKFYNKGGLLYGIFEEKNIKSKQVVYLKETVKKKRQDRAIALENFNFYKIMTEDDLNLLKKHEIVEFDKTAKSYKFYIDRLRLNLKKPEEQIKQFVTYKTNSEHNLSEVGLLYVDNNGKEHIKSIAAVAYSSPINKDLVMKFKREILPIYKQVELDLKFIENDKKNREQISELQSKIKNIVLVNSPYKSKLKKSIQIVQKQIKNKKNDKDDREQLKKLKKELEDRLENIEKNEQYVKKLNDLLKNVISDDDINFLKINNIENRLNTFKLYIEDYIENYSKNFSKDTLPDDLVNKTNQMKAFINNTEISNLQKRYILNTNLQRVNTIQQTIPLNKITVNTLTQQQDESRSINQVNRYITENLPQGQIENVKTNSPKQSSPKQSRPKQNFESEADVSEFLKGFSPNSLRKIGY